MKALFILLTLFRVAFVGDPQVDNATQLGYARASIYRELRERKDLDLVILLGDLVNDKMEYLAPTVASLDSLGCPWLAVPGNHDRDRYPGDSTRVRDLDTWQRTLGYIDTSFVRHGIRFILMNDVRTRGRADYEAGLSERQKEWLSTVLDATPEKQQIVFASHIPLTEMHAKDTLDRLFAGKERVLLVSGVPDALMNCGAPRGYFICDFSCSGYRLSYKQVAGEALATLGTGTDGRLAVNVFGGSKEGTVKIRTGGRTVALERVSTPAPEVLARIESNLAMTREYRRAHREEFIPLRRIASPHVWVAPEGTSISPGDRITVIYRDRRMRFKKSLNYN